jgi:predicted metalloprotease with PDZ domain
MDAGVNVDDEILAIDEYRVRADQLAARLENYRPGDRVSMLVARRDRLTRLELRFAEQPDQWQLEVKPDFTAEQKRHLDAWLGPAGK